MSVTEPRQHVEVDFNRCEGHGYCEQYAPEVFSLDDDGELTLKLSEVSGELVEKAEQAAGLCPVAAIRLSAIKGSA